MRVLLCVLLPAILVVVGITVSPAYAEPAPRGQRPIAEDIAIDQYLAVPLTGATAPEPAAAPTPDNRAEHADWAERESEMHIASVGPAMRPLRTTFEPVWPARGIITTLFGETGPLSPRGHAGVDVAAPTGTPILAMDDGEVVKADFENPAYGGLIVIWHTSGYETWYAHMSRVGVDVGARVTRGAEIGRMGSTGYSTGSHLHFEVRQAGLVVDPMHWLQAAALRPAR